MFTGWACRHDTWSRGDCGRQAFHGRARVRARLGVPPRLRDFVGLFADEFICRKEVRVLLFLTFPELDSNGFVLARAVHTSNRPAMFSSENPDPVTRNKRPAVFNSLRVEHRTEHKPCRNDRSEPAAQDGQNRQ